MSHSKVRVWVHAIFATKYREAQIYPSIEKTVHQFLFDQFVKHSCYVDCINGMPDHIHALFLLSPKKALADVMEFVKGGSSHLINQTGLLNTKFAWQVGYSAFSVSESKTSVVRRYIQQQKSHHLGQNFAEELEWLERINGIIPDTTENTLPENTAGLFPEQPPIPGDTPGSDGNTAGGSEPHG